MMKQMEQTYKDDKQRLLADVESLKQKVYGYERMEQELREVEDRTRQQFASQIDEQVREIRVKNEELSSFARENKLLEKSLKEYKTSNRELLERVETLQRELFDERSKYEDVKVESEKMKREIDDLSKQLSLKFQTFSPQQITTG